MNTHRARVAKLTNELFAGTITFRQLIEAIPASVMEDEDVSDLIALIEHEPQRGGFLGVSHAEHDKYRAAMQDLVARLVAS